MKFSRMKDSQELGSVSSGEKKIHCSDVEEKEEAQTFGSCLTES